MALKIYICDAAKDENGLDGYEGSTPGNQHKLTGNPNFPDEVRTIEWDSVRDFWWKNRYTRVYRLLREDMSNAIAIRMKQACDNPHCGYSQPKRVGIWDELKHDPDPSHIKKDIEMDCSSLMNSVIYVTFRSVDHPEISKLAPLARTADMPSMFSNIDEIVEVTDRINLGTGEGLKKGDILVIPNGHTACVWEVKEVEEPEVPYIKGKATTELYLRTEPSALAKKCNIQMRDDMQIRNYLRTNEEVRVVGVEKNWYQLKIDGVYTWYPWVSSKYIELV